MSDSFWRDILPECPWPEDQGDRDRLWEGREPVELPDFNLEEVMRTSWFHWHEGSRPLQGQTNQGFEERQEDKVELWNEREPLELSKVKDEEVMSKFWFHWHEGSRPDSRETNLELDRIWEDKIQLI